MHNHPSARKTFSGAVWTPKGFCPCAVCKRLEQTYQQHVLRENPQHHGHETRMISRLRYTISGYGIPVQFADLERR